MQVRGCHKTEPSEPRGLRKEFIVCFPWADTSRTAKTRLETKMHVGGAGHTVETAWLQQISCRGLRKVFAKLKRQPDKAVCKATYKRKL